MRLALAAVALVVAVGPGWALPDGYIDPANAVLKVGALRTNGTHDATVGITVINNYKETAEIIAVHCTALVDGEPVESHYGPVQGLAAGQTGYRTVGFSTLNGRTDATASCRVEYIKVH